ncbi:MAG: hypothetical protein ACTSPI_00065 [Candidatus Heimdallarchaeaceae archaeon]
MNKFAESLGAIVAKQDYEKQAEILPRLIQGLSLMGKEGLKYNPFKGATPLYQGIKAGPTTELGSQLVAEGLQDFLPLLLAGGVGAGGYHMYNKNKELNA